MILTNCCLTFVEMVCQFSQSWQSNVINISHVLSPTLTLVAYLIASVIYTLRSGSETAPTTTKPQISISKRTTIFLTAGVVLLLLVESVVLACADPFFAITTNADIGYTLFSTLVWMILAFQLLDTDDKGIVFRYSGSWTVSFILETILLVLDTLDTGLPRPVKITRNILRCVRLALILGLLALPLGAKIRYNGEKASDEETAPLLVASVQNDGTPAHSTPSGGGYGTAQSNGHADKSSNKVSDSKPDDKKAGTSAAATEDSDEDDVSDYIIPGKMKQNWWVYAKAFTFFLPYVWPKSRRLQLYLLVQGLSVFARRFLQVLVPLTLGSIINSLQSSGFELTLSNTTGAVGAPGLIRRVPWTAIGLFFAMKYLNGQALGLVEEALWLPFQKNAHLQLSNAAYTHIMTLSCDFHDKKKSSMIWQTMGRGTAIADLFKVLSFDMLPMMVDLVTAISVFWWLFDSYMAFIVSCVVFLYLWATKKSIALKASKQRAMIKSWEFEYQQLAESTMNWVTVSYFNRIKYEIGRYAKAVLRNQDDNMTYHLFSYALSTVRGSIMIIGQCAGFCLAAYQVVYGGRKVGDVVVFLTYWAELNGPLQYFSYGFSTTARQLIDAEKLLTLFQKTPSVADVEGASELILKQGEVDFKNISFSYDGKRQVINNVSLHADAGDTIALVGETGGGKSTMLKLLFRFYDVTKGEILIDGQDVRKVTIESLHENIGVVPQDPVLFNDTVLANLRYANLDASEEEVQAACKAVALHDKIMSFTKGYQEKVGERGVRMSGGELQRMAIARAILKDPKILLLDEATSSVDSETEAQIQASLKTLCAGRTTFVIAHRLSTIVHADQVVVIMNGQIVERGTHEDLLKTEGHYHKLWSRQLKLQSGESHSRSPSGPNAKDRTPILVNDMSSGDDNVKALKESVDHANDGEAAGVESSHHDHTYITAEKQGGLGPFVDIQPRKRRGRSPGQAIVGSTSRKMTQSRSPEKSKSDTQVPTVLKADAAEFVPRPLDERMVSTLTEVGDSLDGNAAIGGVLKSDCDSYSKSTTALAPIEEEKNTRFWSRRKLSPAPAIPTSQGQHQEPGKEEANVASGTKIRRRSMLSPKRKNTKSEPFNDSNSAQVDGAEEEKKDHSGIHGTGNMSGQDIYVRRTISAPSVGRSFTNDDNDSMNSSDAQGDGALASSSIKAPANTPVRGSSGEVENSG